MSIEDPRISATASENVSHDFRQDIHEDASIEASARQGVEVAQADNSQQPDKSDRVPAAPQVVAANAHPTEIVPDQNNVAHLPADVAIDDIRVEGNNLVLVQADGTEIVIVNGALHVPTFLLGEVELPQQAVIAALEQSNINVAAGPDGSYTASAGAPSSGAEFQDAIQPDPNDPLQLAQLLADTQQPDPGLGERRELFDDQPTIFADRTTNLSLTETEGEEGGFETQSMNGTFGFDGGANVGQITAVQFFDSLNMNEGTNTGSHVDLTSDGKPVVISVNGLTITGSVDGQPVFVLTVTNTATGAFTFTQFAPLDHPDKGEAGLDDILRLQFSYTVTDKDGDAVTGIASVDINDGGPSIGDAVSPSGIDESDLLSGEGGNASVENVSLGIHWGADAGEHRDLTFSNVQDQLSGLKSDGQTVQFEISADGHTLTGFVGEGEGRTEVFVVTLDPKAANGAYSFTLLQPLDHPQNSETGNTQLGLSFNFVASDADGDTANGSFAVDVNDDVPTATGTADTVTEAAGAQGAFIPQTAIGNLDFHQGADGAQVTNITYRFDTAVMEMPEKEGEEIEFHALTSNGKQIVVTTSADGLTVTGKVGDITIFTLHVTDPKTGAYTFTQTGPIDHPDKNDTGASDTLRMVFDFTVTDGDGDKTAWNEGTLTIDINDDGPTINGVAQAANLLANGNFKDDGWQQQNWDNGGYAGSATGGIGWKVEGTGGTVQLERVSNGYLGMKTSNGAPMVDMGSSPGNTTISQDVVGLKAGETLNLSFEVGSPDTASAKLLVYWNNQLVGTFDNLSQMKLVTIKGLVASDTGSNQLTFKEVGTSDYTGTYLANISLTESANVPVFKAEIGEDSKDFSFELAAGKQFSFGADGKGAVTLGSASVASASGISLALPAEAYSYKDGHIVINSSYVQSLNAGEIAKISIPFTVTDFDGDSKTGVYQITVTGENDAATITGTVTGAVTEDASVLTASGKLDIADVDHGEAHFQAPGSLSGTYGTFTFNAATGAWTYALNNSLAAVQALKSGQTVYDTLSVLSADGTASQQIKVTVTGTNDGPVAVEDTAFVKEAGLKDGGNAWELGDWEAKGNVLANDTDVDIGDTKSVSALDGSWKLGNLFVREGTYGTLTLNKDGSYTYVLNNLDPDTNRLGQGEQVVDSFSYTVKDASGATSTTTLKITVEGTNDAPSASFQYGGVKEGVSTADISVATGNLLAGATDSDNNHVLSVATVDGQGDGTAGVAGTYGKLTWDTASGAYSYALDNTKAAVQALAKNEVRFETFTFTITDEHGATSTRTLTVQINGTNDAPTVVAGAVSNELVEAASDFAGTTTASVMLTKGDVDHFDSASYDKAGWVSKAGNSSIWVKQTTYGTVELNTNTGKLTYLLDAGKSDQLKGGETVTDTVTVTVKDESGVKTSTTVDFKVNGTNDAAIISGNQVGSVTEDGGVANAIKGQATATGTLSATDVDSAATFNVQSSVATAYGHFTIDASGNWSYVLDNANSAVQALNVGSTPLHDTITVTTADGTAKVIDITVNGANDAAVLSSDVRNLTEGNSPAAISTSGTLTITDVDNPAKFEPRSDVVGNYGTFSIDADGKWTYTASSAHNEFAAGTTYTDVFLIKAVDGTSTSVTVNIAGTNDAPVFTSSNTVSVEENSEFVVKLTSADPDQGATAGYSISGGKDASLFKIDANGNLVFKSAPDFENPDHPNWWDHSGSSYQVEVKVSDGKGGEAYQTINVTVTDVNEAPVLRPDTKTVTYVENSDAVTLLWNADLSDPDNPSHFAGGSIKVELGDTVAGDKIVIADLSAVRVDGASVQVWHLFSGWQTVGTITTGGIGSVSLTITLNDKADPADVETVLRGLAFASSSDNPTAAERTATITFNDGGHDGSGGPLSDSSTVTIKVVPVNDDPTITSDGGRSEASISVAENQTGVTTVVSTDPDGGSPIYSIKQTWGTDYDRFVIDPKTGVLSFKTTPNYENPQDGNHNNKYVVDVQVSDGHGGYDVQTLTVTVTDVNEAPVLTPDSAVITYTENTAAMQLMSGAKLTDPDQPSNFGGGTITVSLGETAVAGDQLSLVNANGVTISNNVIKVGNDNVGTVSGYGSTSLTITLNNNANTNDVQAILKALAYQSTSENPTGADRVATITFNDGGHDGSGGPISDTSQITIHVTAINDAPVISDVDGTLSYTENDAAKVIDGSITISDVDDANMTGATVKITGNYASGQDVLSFTNQNGITGSWNASTGTLTLSGSASKAAYEAALESIKYQNTSEDPSTQTRTVSFSVHDGDVSSNVGTASITVTAVNDAPVISDVGGTLSYTENDAAKVIDGSITISDVDDANMTGATVKITGNYASGQDVLSFTNQNGITGSWNASTGTLTLSGSASKAAYEAALESIKYQNTSEDPSTQTRTVSFSVHDGDVSSNVGTASITVTAVNDAPVISDVGGTLSYTENDAAKVIDGSITISDVDDANMTGATVKITGNYASGQDVLSFTNQNGITGSWNASTGTLTLSGSASKAAYEAALESIKYQNTSEDPSTQTRTVSFSVHDGDVSSNVGTASITVTAINDAPVISDVGGTLSYTENDAAKVIDGSITISDVDDANMTGATVKITGNYASGQDVLSFTNQNGITGSWNASTGTLTLSGSASKAAYEAALESIKYQNTSEDPSTQTRTVSFSVHDGDVSSNVGTASITVTAINDAPVISDVGGTLSYTENDAAKVIDGSITISDVDDANMTGATVKITGNYASGQDVLSFTNQNGITGSWNASTGTLTLSGSASKAAYEAALESIKYQNTSEGPSTQTRTVSFSVHDGDVSSNVGTASITVTEVPDTKTVYREQTQTEPLNYWSEDHTFGFTLPGTPTGTQTITISAKGDFSTDAPTEFITVQFWNGSNYQTLGSYGPGLGNVAVQSQFGRDEVRWSANITLTAQQIQAALYSGQVWFRLDTSDDVNTFKWNDFYGVTLKGNYVVEAQDPIILDLDHNGVALTSLDHGVSFDINADGHKDQIAWTAGTDGILAYDVDGNGKIDNGSEIFSPHFAGGTYVDGLAALSTLDSNHDGKIDAADEAFSKLTVWQDLNHNGITDSGELSSLADHSISSISLDANASNSEINGQSILADGSYTLTDGSTGHFVEVAFDTTLGGSENGSAYSLIGSDGDDTLSGNGGMYTISGGAGADTFVLDTDALADVKLADVITDFKAGEGDTLDVSKLLDSLLGHEASEAEALASVKTTVSGADTVVSVNANGGWHDVAVLQNVTEAVKILYDDKHDTTTAPHAG